MATDLSLLVGIHDPDILQWVKTSAEIEGFSVYTASCLEEMKQLMQENNFRGYLMDLNLRRNGTIYLLDLTPAREMYAAIHERVERGEALFLGVSGRDELVEAALAEHIPAELKPFHLFPFLHRCQELKTK